MSISEFHELKSNISQTQPGTPASTNSLTPVMCGLAIAFTPKMTGKVKLYVQCNCTSDTISDGVRVGLRYGTGTAPVNGAADTGTVGSRNALVQLTAATIVGTEITIIGYNTGLIVGTAYWFDIAQNAITGGNVTVGAINYIIEEVQN